MASLESLIHWIFFLCLALASGCRGKVLTLDYEWNEQARGWLKYHAVPSTWDDARLQCQVEGAVLASPHTNEQKAAIVLLVQQQNGFEDVQVIFTGVHATFSNGDYSSIEGVPLLRLAITWSPGEPDNYDDLERCLTMRIGYNGTMADTRCDRVLPYVCYKKDTNSTGSEKEIDYEYEWSEQDGSTKHPVTPGSWYQAEAKEYRFDYTWSEQAQGWLKYHVVPSTWNEAKLRCQAEGARLSSPRNARLKAAIVNFIQNQTAVDEVINIFTGAYETSDIEEYLGSCSTMSINGTTLTFGTSCMKVLPYVCFKEDTELTMTECGTTDTGYVLEPSTGSCYKFQNSGVVWSKAYMTCVAEGGYLAIINSDVEAEVIRQILAKQPRENFYTHYGMFHLTAVGIYDWSNLGSSFSTIHGDALEATYNNWQAGEPNNYPNICTDDPGEYCGTVNRDLKLYDYACHVPTAFLCEKMPDSLFNSF